MNSIYVVELVIVTAHNRNGIHSIRQILLPLGAEFVIIYAEPNDN